MSSVSTSEYSGKSKTEMYGILRREIRAARLKVTLDKNLGRETSDTVKKLANMKLPDWSLIEEKRNHHRKSSFNENDYNYHQ